MVTLYVFNPEHDLALASNLSNFTAPHAGRRLRSDLGYLPAIWAGENDYILVDHVDMARKAYARLRARIGGGPRQFVDKNQLSHLAIDEVSPWGWDPAIRSFLLRHDVGAVPSDPAIRQIRDLSHREHAAAVLAQLQCEGMVGQSVKADGLDTVVEKLNAWGRVVVKAPWSSSGRGIRFIEGTLNDYHSGWIRNVIQRQGSVMVEPYYNKVKDFGMEFSIDEQGGVHYLGLSLFHTRNGAYTGNLIATEEEKIDILSRYIPVDLIANAKEKIMASFGPMCQKRYQGPFGVDMMIVARPDGDGFLLHPCVEINLRRTMGHVALAIPPFADGYARVMQIALTDKYRIRVRKT